MKLTAAVGLLIGAVLSGACYRLWGTQAAVAAGAFAALAIAIQLGALGLVQPVRDGLATNSHLIPRALRSCASNAGQDWLGEAPSPIE